MVSGVHYQHCYGEKEKMTVIYCKNKCCFLIFFLLFIFIPCVYSSEYLTSFRLSKQPVQFFFDAGKKTDTPIRWFADDDYGLSRWLADLREKKIMVSSPYELLPAGKDFIFVGIGAVMQKCQTAEIIDFARQGNLVVLLLSAKDFSFRKKEFSNRIPIEKEKLFANDQVFCFSIGQGRVVLIQDPFAFCNARFQGNRPLWEYLQKERKYKAVRIVQRDCYVRDRSIFSHSSRDRKITPRAEHDPAFAPSFTDSNSKKYYQMTQNYYFLPEKYIMDGREIKDWKSMMRVRAYDTFVPPDETNPNEWHFSISDRRSSQMETDSKIPDGFKKITIQTALTKDSPPDRVTLASLAPESLLLDSKVYSVEVQDIELEKKLAEELNRRNAAFMKQTQKKDSDTPWWSIVKVPDKKPKPVSVSAQIHAETKKLQQQYETVKERNRLIGKGRPWQIIHDIQVVVNRDKLNNWTAVLKPKNASSVFIIYEVAVPKIFLRLDERDFDDKLLRNDLSIMELCRQQRMHGIDPCFVPQHEKEALKRMIGKERFAWFQPDKSPSGRYLPPPVEQALQGKNIFVKDLFRSLSDYARKELKDADVFMKEEFNSFHEAMLYWKAGVCRHRARLGYMILNTLGIAARCVTTREHAYVEVYLPMINGGKGGWTYLDFGGGQGAEMPDVPFEIIPAENSSGIPSPNNAAKRGAGLPSSGRAPTSGFGIGAAFSNQYLLIPILFLFAFALFFFVFRQLHKKRQSRISMPFEGDFMASYETILTNEMKDHEYASAALILLEAAAPKLKDSALLQAQTWQHAIQHSMHCSPQQYQKIVNYIKKNHKEGENLWEL